jgi:hypothetical protein
MIRLFLAMIVCALAPLRALALEVGRLGPGDVIQIASMSPDGKHVAVAHGTAERGEVSVLDSEGGRVRVAGGRHFIQLSWVGPEHLLAIHSRMLGIPGLLPRQQVSQAISVNLRTRRSVTLLDLTPNVAAILAGGLLTAGESSGRAVVYLKGLALIGPLTRDPAFVLFRADADKGRGEPIQTGSLDTQAWVVTPEGRVIARSDYEPTRRMWSLYAARPGGLKLLVQESRSEPPSVLSGRTEDSIAVATGANLAELSLTGAWRRNLVPAGKDVVAQLSNPATGRLVGAVVTGQTPGYVFFDPALEAAWRRVNAAFPGKSVSLIDFDSDYKQFIAEIKGENEPRAEYWVHVADGTAELIGRTAPAPEPKAAPARP